MSEKYKDLWAVIDSNGKPLLDAPFDGHDKEAAEEAVVATFDAGELLTKAGFSVVPLTAEIATLYLGGVL